MTYVTCPTIRYHPAIVAQKAATMGILSNNRFRLGLGAGENLNEHVVGPALAGGRRPPPDAPRGGRHHRARCSTATESLNYRGEHFDVEQARLWDLPDERVPIGIAVSGPDSCRLAGEKGDIMIAVEPEAELGEHVRRRRRRGQAAGGAGGDLLRPGPRRGDRSAPTSSSAGSASAGR